jgi:dTDP-4-amino-4,6-dideoxygalactose transaminase
MGLKYGYKEGDLPLTEEYSLRLLRLPLYADLTMEEAKKVCSTLKIFFKQYNK